MNNHTLRVETTLQCVLCVKNTHSVKNFISVVKLQVVYNFTHSLLIDTGREGQSFGVGGWVVGSKYLAEDNKKSLRVKKNCPVVTNID